MRYPRGMRYLKEGLSVGLQYWGEMIYPRGCNTQKGRPLFTPGGCNTQKGGCKTQKGGCNTQRGDETPKGVIQYPKTGWGQEDGVPRVGRNTQVMQYLGGMQLQVGDGERFSLGMHHGCIRGNVVPWGNAIPPPKSQGMQLGAMPELS